MIKAREKPTDEEATKAEELVDQCVTTNLRQKSQDALTEVPCITITHEWSTCMKIRRKWHDCRRPVRVQVGGKNGVSIHRQRRLQVYVM